MHDWLCGSAILQHDSSAAASGSDCSRLLSCGPDLGLLLVLQVTVFSTSEKKRAEALKTLKADHFVVSKDEEQMKVRQLTQC